MPKYGSWLNMAEIEVEVVSTQGSSRGLQDQQTVCRELAAREANRNAAKASAD
jgi:hypothetical protein